MQDAGCTGFLGSVEALFVLLVFLVRCIYCAVSVWEGSAEAFRNEVYPGGGGISEIASVIVVCYQASTRGSKR